MSSFTTPLDVEFIDGRVWKLSAPFEFASEVLEANIKVPEGFITDFASIPRGLWNVLPPIGKYGKAAVIHDYLYQMQAIVKSGILMPVNRGQADKVLREGMEVLGCSRMTRWTIYAGVRTGGWVTWRRYQNNDHSS